MRDIVRAGVDSVAPATYCWVVDEGSPEGWRTAARQRLARVRARRDALRRECVLDGVMLERFLTAYADLADDTPVGFDVLAADGAWLRLPGRPRLSYDARRVVCALALAGVTLMSASPRLLAELRAAQTGLRLLADDLAEGDVARTLVELDAFVSSEAGDAAAQARAELFMDALDEELERCQAALDGASQALV